jgi:hypothetical protein
VIRERMHIVARDRAGWNRALETVAECNRLSEERGWPASRVWKFVAGRMSELVVETDYPDLAAFERVQQERHHDGGWQIMTKPLVEAMVEERSYSELLESAATQS